MWRMQDKMITVSCAFAAAGILACVAALFNVLVPSGAVLRLAIGMVVLPVMITIAVVGFVGLCDGCEGFLNARKRKPPRKKSYDAVGKAEPQNDTAAKRSQTFYPIQRISDFNDRYVGGLRGAARGSGRAATAAFGAKRWHGQ